VQLEAPRARFEVAFAQAIFALVSAPLPILEMAGSSTQTYLRDPLPEFDNSPTVFTQSLALGLERGLSSSSADPLRASNDLVRSALLTLKRRGALCGAEPPKVAIEKLHWVAEMTLANLAPERNRALWIDPKWLGCGPGSLSPPVRDRLVLYAAIASRDARAMLERARKLLAGPAEGGNDWGRFLLLTAMLGGHAAGEHGEADRLWQTYRKAFYPSGAIPPHMVYVSNLR
jgi:hypothetical protein